MVYSINSRVVVKGRFVLPRTCLRNSDIFCVFQVQGVARQHRWELALFKSETLEPRTLNQTLIPRLQTLEPGTPNPRA